MWYTVKKFYSFLGAIQMRKKEMIAMLLAGGQGSRMGVLTATKAKPAVPFGGKYRLIDFPMSNCINSGVDTVGVMTQYLPLQLNQHIGIGIPWDLDRQSGGVTVLTPHVKSDEGEWYTGSANAVYQNIGYINDYNPEYVLVLSGDHIYKMDYYQMLAYHKANGCDVTIAAMEVPWEEVSRYGVMNTREDNGIYEFEEKPPQPKNNLINMGVYIFNWPILREALIKDNKVHPDSDFGKHVLPMLLNEGARMYAYRFNDYWRDVGTVDSYWHANMDLVKTLPDFNLYDDFWKIYTESDHQPPMYTGPHSDVRTSLLSEGCEVFGRVYNSILGPGVLVEEGASVTDSIVLEGCVIGRNTRVERCILDDHCIIGEDVVIGEGENIPNREKPSLYDTGITVLGDYTVVPPHVSIGKNCVVYGNTEVNMYPDNRLESGSTLIIEVTAEGE
jgi:glucose-1-phosphate adenylyltransferase